MLISGPGAETADADAGPELRVDELAAADRILKDDALFSTSAYRSMGPDLSGSRRVMLAEGEEHRLLRQALVRGLSHRRVEHWALEVFRPAAEKFARLLPDSAPFAPAGAFAAPYCREALYALIGLDERDGDRLVAAYQQAYEASTNPAMAERREPARKVLDAVARRVLIGGVVPAAMPAETTLAGHLRRFRLGATPLDDAGVVLLILPLIETLAVKINRDVVCTTLKALATMDAQGQTRVRTDAIYDGAVLEALRLQRGTLVPRAVASDCAIELGGEPVRLTPGCRVLLDVEMINRDPAVFTEPEPDRYAPWRPAAVRSLSFGAGAHRCPGQTLAVSLAAEACRAVLSRGWLAPAPSESGVGRLRLTAWDAARDAPGRERVQP